MIVTRGFGKNPVTRGYGRVGFYTAMVKRVEAASREDRLVDDSSHISRSLASTSALARERAGDSVLLRAFDRNSALTRHIVGVSLIEREEVEIG